MTDKASPADIRPLLVELLTEELPPKALENLGLAFAEGLRAALDKHGLLADGCTVTPFATPRRLAVRLSAVQACAADRDYTERLMPVKVGLTQDGAATPALQKKLAAKGWAHLTPADLTRESDGKQDYLVARGTSEGADLAHGLQDALDTAIAGLPIPKVMRYQLADGVTSVRFVRPAHGLIALFGTEVIEVHALGMTAGRSTHGHRFVSTDPVILPDADSYESHLAEFGNVIASFDARRADIDAQLQAKARELGATLGDDPEVPALLNEVTALVEQPTVYVGAFDEAFLDVPQECLILTMRLNQKYFPLFDPATGKLTHRFLIVSNMRVADPINIVGGNERVVRPRLADAKFFFDTDRKMPLASRVAQLDTMVYHNKLGTQGARVTRVRALAAFVAQTLGGDAQAADRAALLAKADLGTNMVGEFPELQGVMGAYYAQGDGEPAAVVTALREQYRIRWDQPVDDATLPAVALFIADRAETLIGIWSIGGAPTGERDPFGLRRAALGLISAFEQLAAGGRLKISDDGPLTLDAVLEHAAQAFGPGKIDAAVIAEVRTFLFERYRNQLANTFERSGVDAVIAVSPPLHQVAERVRAVVAFGALPEAASLAAANKRIGNLLKKAEGDIGQVDEARLSEPAERALAAAIAELEPQSAAQFAEGDFAGSLQTLARGRAAVDAFFNDIMVMAEDPAIRANRLALLAQLHRLMNRVADISRLAQ